ncbi:kinase [Paenisporosarcina macmurdoensis]|uniref:Kinase n=1 Tax=Paenisporosarcina macmurdoensis TaxID=212659 RepID=A0ABW1L9A2_9BACL
MEKHIEALLNFISSNDINDWFILGLDGLSRSGKTTLSQKLCKILKEKNIPYQIIHIDDHIVEREKRYHTGHEEWVEYYYLQWDVEWLTNNLFGNLKISGELNLPFYDVESDTAMLKTIQLPVHGVIVIEGVFLQRKEWRRFFDRVVYLDCPRSKRFVRESEEAQENLSKFTNRYWKAEDFYLSTVSPKEQADLVIKKGK